MKDSKSLQHPAKKVDYSEENNQLTAKEILNQEAQLNIHDILDVVSF